MAQEGSNHVKIVINKLAYLSERWEVYFLSMIKFFFLILFSIYTVLKLVY